MVGCRLTQGLFLGLTSPTGPLTKEGEVVPLAATAATVVGVDLLSPLSLPTLSSTKKRDDPHHRP